MHQQSLLADPVHVVAIDLDIVHGLNKNIWCRLAGDVAFSFSIGDLRAVFRHRNVLASLLDAILVMAWPMPPA